MGNAVKYREPLPDDCPLPGAVDIVETRIVYRLVWSDPPSHNDFRSYADLNPDKPYKDNTEECKARGVSVYKNPRAADKNRQRFANLAETLICEVVLVEGAGRIKRTGSRTHFTWWPLAEYDILANCQVAE